LVLNHLDLISFRIADLKVSNALPVPLDCSGNDPARHHHISHLCDFLGEQHWSLAISETSARGPEPISA
jgi:hypothetical protein